MAEADGGAARPVRIAVAGALGRMGLAVARLLDGRADAVVAARLDRAPGDGLVDLDAALDACDAVIDFTTPAASAALAARVEARALAGQGAPAVVIGSTGFDIDQARAFDRLAGHVAVVKSGNFSLGVNVLLGLAAQAAAILPAADFDVEVVEAHHRRKVDAPSGAALMLGEAAAAGRGVALADVADRGRDGITGARREGAIGFAAVRGGGIVGEHSVLFAGEEEVLTLSHSARDRALFARGAVRAALWAVGRPSGLYTMQDVLGFGAGGSAHRHPPSS